jgi:hypothetical protein
MLTTPNISIITKHVVFVVTTKSTTIYINCGKIGHILETSHNKY